MIVKYPAQQISQVHFQAEMQTLKQQGCQTVLLPVLRGESIYRNRSAIRARYQPLDDWIPMCRNIGLGVGVYLDCFQSWRLSQLDNFSPPVAANGAAFVYQGEYAPLCPNDPAAMARYYRILHKIATLPKLDFYYLENLQFPFFWQREDLDIQHRIPPFCYCPFCTTEFSSVVGEIINSVDAILKMMPEWLEWRTIAILNLLLDAKEILPEAARIIVAVPPLGPIDIPFTTGQLPLAFTDEHCIIAPRLHFQSLDRSHLWAEDILEQYQIDMRRNHIYPELEMPQHGCFGDLPAWSRHYPHTIFSSPAF